MEKMNLENLIKYVEDRGHLITIDTNPTDKKIKQHQDYADKAEGLKSFMIRAMASKLEAFKLLEKAYQKGTFDDIIKHLEEAKEIKR